MSGKPRKFLKVIDSLKSWNNQGSQQSQSPKLQVEIEERLKPEDFHFGKIARHGFPCDARCIAFDPVQKLLAIGTKRGSIRVLGRAGVDCHLKHPTITAPIQQLIFLVNEGALVSITNEDSVLLWSIRQKQPCVVHTLSFKKEKLTTGFLSLGSKWLYIGTERGNVHFIQVQNFVISGYIINWNKAIDLSMSTHPGSIVQIAENPQDANKLLIGFSTGFLVLWDLRGKMAEARFKCTEPLYSFWWHYEGKQFMTAHEHGILATWNYRQPQKPVSVIHPHDREAQEDITPGKYSAIKRLQWIGTKSGEALLVLAGGEAINPEKSFSSSSTSTSITIIRGKKISVMEMDAPVIDFTVLCDSPFCNDATQPYSIAILLQNDLVLIDLLSPNYPSFKNPYAMDLHQPAVTSCFYLGECPGDLVPALYSVGIRNNAASNAKSSNAPSSSTSTSSSVIGPGSGTDNETNTHSVVSSTSTKDWPINGGQWGSAFSPYSELLVTGHEDGTVKFWDVASAGMNLLYKFRVGKCFDLSAFPKTGCMQTPTSAASVNSSLYETEQDTPLFDKTTSPHPLEVVHIKLCGYSRMLMIAGHYHAILFRFSKKELTTDIPTLQLVTDYDLQDEVREKTEECVSKSSVQTNNSPTYEQEIPRICSPPVRSGNRKWLPGYQAELLCQLAQCASWNIPPSSITCIALSPSYGILAIGTGRGLAVVDYIQRTCLLSTGTPDLYGSMDPYTRVAYKPSMTKAEEGKILPSEKIEKSIEPTSMSSLKSKPTASAATAISPPHRSLSEVGARCGRLPPPPVPVQSNTNAGDKRHRASSAATENKSLSILEENPPPESGHDLKHVTAAMDEILQLVNQTDMEVEEAVEAMSYCKLGTQLSSAMSAADTSGGLGSDWVSVGSSTLEYPNKTTTQGSVEELSQTSPFSSSTHLSLTEGHWEGAMEEAPPPTEPDTSSTVEAEKHPHPVKAAPPPRPPQPKCTVSPSNSMRRTAAPTTTTPLNATSPSSHLEAESPNLSRSRNHTRPQTFSFSSFSLKHSSQQVEVIDLRSDEWHPNLSLSSGIISNVLNGSTHSNAQSKSRFHLFSTKLWNISPLTDKTDLSQLARSTSASATSLETICFEAISALYFVDSYARKSDSVKQPSLWIGTEMGSVLSLSIQIPQRRSTQRIIVTPAGTIFRLCGEIQCIGFLDCKGKLIEEPKTRWEESSIAIGHRAADNDQDSDNLPTPRGKNETITSEAHNGKGGPSSSSTSSSATTSPTSQSDFQIAVFCSEKHARIVSLPSQKCIFKTKITETSEVLRCSLLWMKGHTMLAVYLANGHLLCYSLPSLRLLLDAGDCISQPWGDECRFRQCFAFGHHAQAMYICSPSEIQKISVSMETFSNIKETAVDLFVPCEMPPSPKKNFIQNIFTNVGSTLDRDELFGEASAGKASIAVASVSSNAKMERAQMSSAMAQSEIGKAKLAAIERGQRLNQLDDRTQEMANEAKTFSRNAALLAKKYEEKNKWWPF